MKPNNDISSSVDLVQVGEVHSPPADRVDEQPRTDGQPSVLPPIHELPVTALADGASAPAHLRVQDHFGAEAEFFRDEHNQPFALVSVNDPAPHLECWPVRSQAFRDFLTLTEAILTGDVPKSSPHQWTDQARPGHRPPGPSPRRLQPVCGVTPSGLYIDLADPLWRSIEVTAAGWNVIDNTPVRFERFSHQLAIEPPPRDGDPLKLHDFLPCMSDGDRLLITITAALTPVASIPRPVVIVTGPEGAGQDPVECDGVRSVFDPSSLIDLGETARAQFDLSINQHAVVVFENLGELTSAEVDKICRVTTGSGRIRRALYTDREIVTEKFRRQVFLVGVNLPATRPELFSRAVTVDVLPMDNRKTESELERAFAASLPCIRAGMLELLVEAMNALHHSASDAEFRMADFAMWGRAVCQALGRREGDFVEAYRAAIERQDAASVEASELATVTARFANPEPWTGTTTELWNQLNAIADQVYAARRPRNWPGAPHILTRRLKEVQQTLRRAGVHAVYSESRRGWEIWREASSNTL